MSKKYIEQDAALNVVEELYAEAESPEAAEALFDAHERLADTPPADVKPVVKSNWYKKTSWSIGYGMGEQYGYYWGCGNCGFTVMDGYEECDYTFCPNCGADMRKEQE